MVRIPTGRRQTLNWLFTRMTEELNKGDYPEQHQLVARVGFEPGMTALKSSDLNHLATLTLIVQRLLEGTCR